jgi:hypothetical protein
MFRALPKFQTTPKPKSLDGYSHKIIQLPATTAKVNSERISFVCIALLAASWIGMSLLHDSIFIKEAVVSSFIIGCSVLFNGSSISKNELE